MNLTHIEYVLTRKLICSTENLQGDFNKLDRELTKEELEVMFEPLVVILAEMLQK